MIDRMTNPNPSPELLPCPFCGGEAAIQLDRGRGTVGVGCTKCTACQPPSWDIDSETWARRAWNTRALSQTLPAPGEVERRLAPAIERLRIAVEHYRDNGGEYQVKLPRSCFAGREEWAPWFAIRHLRDMLAALDTLTLATVAAANDEGDWVNHERIRQEAQTSGYRQAIDDAAKVVDVMTDAEDDASTFLALDAARAAIRLLSQGGGK
jgi:hypothetical protein